MTDHEDSARIATAAGALLVELRGRDAPGYVADQASHALIAGLLHEAHAADAVLSEEAADDPARLHAQRVWIVDPLDGTREYSEPGRTDWAVHVALWERGDLVAGAVALPGLGLTLSTGHPGPGRGQPDRAQAHLDQPPLGKMPDGSVAPRLVVSRTRPPAVTEAIRAALGAQLVSLGSAGAKAMAVVRGEADVYAHAGGQYEWDSAAPVAVARAAGLHASRLDGSALRYNQRDPWLPDLLICRPEWVEAVVAAAALTPG